MGHDSMLTTKVLSYWLNHGVRNYTNSMTWRFPIAFQVVLAGVYIIGLIFMPEFPRWYVLSQNHEPTIVSTHMLTPAQALQTRPRNRRHKSNGRPQLRISRRPPNLRRHPLHCRLHQDRTRCRQQLPIQRPHHQRSLRTLQPRHPWRFLTILPTNRLVKKYS